MSVCFTRQKPVFISVFIRVYPWLTLLFWLSWMPTTVEFTEKCRYF